MVGAGLERADDRCTACRLNRKHSWEIIRDPTGGAQLGEGFPHSDQPSPAAGGIDDYLRKGPAELKRELEAEGLLALDPIRLAQGGEIERAGFRRVGPCCLTTVTNVAVQQEEVPGKHANLREN